ncbi:hypothetical protein C7W88_03315 [Novosphingobium sp. THN1]|nr:hypothetical protein C7W88_03315 [Novosphingobium sp. THN1]
MDRWAGALHRRIAVDEGQPPRRHCRPDVQWRLCRSRPVPDQGDTLPYKASEGTWTRIKPKNGVDKGGIGAVQVNARYDWLDLNDNGVLGGRQQLVGASLLWVPTDYVRFIIDYGHLWLKDAAVAAGADRNYNADVIGMRAQFDF